CNSRIRTHCKMVRDAHLTAHYDAIPDNRASGNPDLRADHAMTTKPHVVRNVNLIIQNRTGANHRIFRGAPVYRAIGADLDPVLYDDATELQHSHQPRRSWYKSEALRTDRHPG